MAIPNTSLIGKNWTCSCSAGAMTMSKEAWGGQGKIRELEMISFGKAGICCARRGRRMHSTEGKAMLQEFRGPIRAAR